jgi:hypothetical protein
MGYWGGGIFGGSKLGAGCSKDGLGQDVSATARSGQDARAPLKKWRNLRADLWDKGPCLRRSGFFVCPNHQYPLTLLPIRVPSRPFAVQKSLKSVPQDA